MEEKNYYVDKRTDRYVRWRFSDKSKFESGRIVLEKYDGVWNLELMDVMPVGQGLGTKFLTHVLEAESLDPKNMTVSWNPRSKRFFEKMGFHC